MTASATAFTKAARETFLARLAETANVSASARAAGFPAHRAYQERMRSPLFREQWQSALTEGYARLESELLAEALRPANGNLKDVTLKGRQMKVRLGMSLLTLHRAAVRGGGKLAIPTATEKPAERRKRWESRFSAMHDRLTTQDAEGE